MYCHSDWQIVLFAPAYLQIPIGALLSYVFALFGAPKKDQLKEEEKMDKTPYFAAASNAAYKLGRSLFYAPLKSLYEIGSGVRDLYKSAPRQPSPSTAQASPAPAR